MEDFLEYTFDISGPTLIQPKMRCALVTVRDLLALLKCPGEGYTNVTPFPNHE